ncbi:MAG TPA: DUF1488 domain-containing protein [Burkholderiales bacterium]|jgi:hypothetical protein|nr:DUF1488 domain-containing protein [Burkholderiales bacterium]
MIRFEDGRLYVEPRESVLFFARVGEARIRCYVDRATLVEHFGAKDDAENAYKFCVCAYDRNREPIQELATRLIDEVGLAADGEVLITPSVVPALLVAA